MNHGKATGGEEAWDDINTYFKLRLVSLSGKVAETTPVATYPYPLSVSGIDMAKVERHINSRNFRAPYREIHWTSDGRARIVELWACLGVLPKPF